MNVTPLAGALALSATMWSAGAIAGATPVRAQALEVLDAVSWERASGGAVPRGARALGTDINNVPLYVCMAEFEGRQYLGKLAPTTFKRCNIAARGGEHGVSSYQVPVQGRDGRLHWLSPRDPRYHPRRAVGTRDSNACRAVHVQGSRQLGGTSRDGRKCVFGFGGRVIEQTSFEVLMRGDR